MVECWNIGFQKGISHFNFIVNPVGGGIINPTLHYPLRGVGSTLRPGYPMERKPEPIIDGFVKSLKTSFSVIPAKAGIQ